MLFSFFFLSYLFFRRRRPGERELRSAGGATDQDPSRALHVLLLRSFLYFHGRPFPHSLPPSFFFPTCTHAHEHVMFFYSPSIPTETILSFFFSFSLFQTFCFFFIMMMMGKGIERRGKKGEVLRVSAGAPARPDVDVANKFLLHSLSIHFFKFIFKFFTAIKLIYLLG